MLNGVLPAHAHASARRPSGSQAPGKVGVDECAEGGPLTLPRKVIDAPGPNHQVADQAGEGRP
eukprot:1606778-Alexandrium_andersonii.AAC.1